MNYSFSEEAELELYRAECFFKLHQKEQEFFNDLITQLNTIQEMPYAFQVRYRNVRIVNLEHFGYALHCAILNQSIIILRILNQKQDF